jgi:hypothetical protein
VPSICQFFGVGRGHDLPGYIMLPAFPGYSQGLRRAGPYGGYLGPKWDPVFSTADKYSGKDTSSDNNFYNPNLPLTGEPRLPKLGGELTLDALNDRRSLVQQLDMKAAHFDAKGHDIRRDAAFDLLLSPKAKTAFDLAREPDKLRDRYGRDLFGQSALLARRLVEAGVTFVTVQAGGGWDTHGNNFTELKRRLLPQYDAAIAALVEDLDDRGRGDDVLVMTMGEFGRTPKINTTAGRDHWPGAMSILYAGGGLKMGQMIGTTDSTASYPASKPYTPGCVLSTMYHVVGIDHKYVFHDDAKRPLPVLSEGDPIKELVG